MNSKDEQNSKYKFTDYSAACTWPKAPHPVILTVLSMTANTGNRSGNFRHPNINSGFELLHRDTFWLEITEAGPLKATKDPFLVRPLRLETITRGNHRRRLL
jgi:hypothetical protein